MIREEKLRAMSARAKALWADREHAQKHTAQIRRSVRTRMFNEVFGGYAALGLGAARIAELMELPLEFTHERLRMLYRMHMDLTWELVTAKPLKFPAPDRRRRSDREIPKAA
jgi:hypothetical protein